MKADLHTKFRTTPEGKTKIMVKRSGDVWHELGMYMEVVAFLAGEALTDNPKGINDRPTMVAYIADYINKALPDYESLEARE